MTRYVEQQNEIYEMRDDSSRKQNDISGGNKLDSVELSIVISNNAQEDDLMNNEGRQTEKKVLSNLLLTETMSQCAKSDCEVRKVRESAQLSEDRPGMDVSMQDILEHENESIDNSASERTKVEMEVSALR